MNASSRNSIVIAFLVMALMAGWAISNVWNAERAAPRYALVLPEPMALDDFHLTDQDGKPFDRRSFSGQWTLLFFGFTHCPDICPATLQQLSMARQSLQEAGQTVPQIVLVSVDPDRDTPDLLRAYVEHFGDGVTGVVGPVNEIENLARTLGVYFEKMPSETEDYSVAHSAHVMLIDKSGRYSAVFSPPHSVEHFVHDLSMIMRP